MNLVLIGLRASGKTTLGRGLAKRRDCPFVDLDDRTCSAFEQTTVTDIWAAHGEQAWRNAERHAFDEVMLTDGQIIALGGGTPMIDHVAQRLRTEVDAQRIAVIYLRAEPALLARRLRIAAGDRPSLTGADVSREVAAIAAARSPRYEGLATHVVEIADGDVQDMVVEIDRLLNASGSTVQDA